MTQPGGWGEREGGETCALVAGGWAPLVAQTAKDPPAVQEAPVRALGREDPWRRRWQNPLQ